MTSFLTRLRTFTAELRRRHVFRVAGVYAVVAWGLIQLANNTFPALHLPAWSTTLVVVLALTGFPLTIVLAWAFEITPDGVQRSGSASMEEEHQSSRSREERSIAVLPFVSFSTEAENEYFSDGITEELIDRLVKVRSLRVAARTSSFAFKGQNADISEIGRKLRVSYVLEGSVRRAGGQLRVTAQLIDVESGYHLWSETYQRELADVFSIQDEISHKVVAALEVRLLGGEGATRWMGSTRSVEAYDCYLKGRYHWNKRTGESLRRAVESFEEALRHDPGYSRAYAGLADCYLVLSSGTHAVSPPAEALARAQQSAEKALALDASLVEARVSLGVVRMHLWDWSGAESQLRRATELDPGHAGAHHQYGWLLALLGRLDPALAELRRAQRLDPLSLPIQTAIGRVLQFMRQPDEAIAQYRLALDMDSSFAGARFALGLAFLQKGMPREAIAALQRAREQTGTPGATVLLAYAFATAGDREQATALLRDLTETRGQYVSPQSLADLHVALGEHDEAFEWYERAYEERLPGLMYLAVEPLLDALRTDPRFHRLLRKIGLAEYGLSVPAVVATPK